MASQFAILLPSDCKTQKKVLNSREVNDRRKKDCYGGLKLRVGALIGLISLCYEVDDITVLIQVG